jgi:Na+/H+ antiporter 1
MPTPRSVRSGSAGLHLDLTLGQWASDGLLAVFFFVAGLELKREFVAGDLRDVRRAFLRCSRLRRDDRAGHAVRCADRFPAGGAAGDRRATARTRIFRRMEEEETQDADDDAIPDVYQGGSGE